MRPKAFVSSSALAAFAVTSLLAGCGRARNMEEHADGPTTCIGCHGGLDNSTGAPPFDTTGQGGNGRPGGGAHTAHIDAGVACASCHPVPARIVDPSTPEHLDGKVQVVFGGVALLGGAPTPSFDPTTGACSNVYCHGRTLLGGTLKTPVWTAGDGASACTACHGAPPDPTSAMSGGRGLHPSNVACGSCHPGATSTAVDPAIHVNGSVQVLPLTCHTCHGGAGNDAPPTDTTGGAEAARVGAHQAHVAGMTYSNGLGGGGAASCAECHGVLPTATRHADGLVQIAWGGLASTGFTPTPAVTSVVPGSPITCTNACHNVRTASGGSAGGSRATISWTDTITACDSCHSIPSWGGLHVAQPEHQTACGECHPDAYSTTTVDRALHVNGQVEVTAIGWNPATRSCGGNGSNCHGRSVKGPW